MRNFLKIADGQDTVPLRLALSRSAHLWNTTNHRTTFPGSPHAEADDIICRFESLSGVEADDPALGEKLERAAREWWPAWYALPEARAFISPLMARVGAYELARVLITRLAPGKRILPHADIRGAYANLPDIARYHIVIQGDPGCLFHCGAETVNMRTGEVWWFNARETHAVENNSGADRIHLLVDVRVM